jgi:2-phospho-L-lactate/phosphoenolpyruvate guanylyltransferase
VYLIPTDAALPALADESTARTWRPWAVIPAKRFGRAKSRLGSVLHAGQRRALAGDMFEGVLQACNACPELEGTLVATDGDDVAGVAKRRGVAVLRDRDPRRGAGPTLSDVVDGALAAVAALGATHALVVMADLPWLRAHDLRELLAQLRSADMVLAPDLKRRGTSALGLRLALGAQSCFGHPDSLRRHLAEATRVRASTRIVHNPRVAFDLDSATDLSSLRPAPPRDRSHLASVSPAACG